MSKEWKVELAVESGLEKDLQGLDGNGFEVHGIFSAPDSLRVRFIVVGRRELPEGRKKRRYEARPVAIRASNGLFLRWHGNSDPLRAVSVNAGDPETFWMIRLEGSYGESIAAFRAGADQWLSMPNETFSGPATLYGPEVGSWQMFWVLPRDGTAWPCAPAATAKEATSSSLWTKTVDWEHAPTGSRTRDLRDRADSLPEDRKAGGYPLE